MGDRFGFLRRLLGLRKPGEKKEKSTTEEVKEKKGGAPQRVVDIKKG
jgi:hypothetical protein